MKHSPYQTEIYLIRHAETVMNVDTHLVGGRSNHTPLTDRGVEQARTLGRALLANNILPDSVYASLATRAVDTANHTLEAMNSDLTPVIEEHIQELSQGLAEGRRREEIYTTDVIASIGTLGKDFKLEGGESMNEVGERMLNWTKTRFYTPEGTPAGGRHLVFTHGGSIKYLISQVLGWDHPTTYQTPIDNTSVSLLSLDEDGINVEYINRLPSDLK